MKIIDKKKLPILVVAFLISQVIIDCLNTVTFFPFLHYGMFSQVYKSKEFKAYEIKTDGKILSGGNFGTLTWDGMHYPLSSFEKQISTRDFNFDKKAIEVATRKTGMNNLFLTISSNLNNSQHLSRDFPLWYKGYLAKLIHRKINKLEVTIVSYRYDNGKYIVLDRIKWFEV